jgi:hypothetical protein
MLMSTARSTIYVIRLTATGSCARFCSCKRRRRAPLGDDYDLRREIDACHVAGRLSESSLFASDAVAVRVVMTPISWVPFGGRRETHHFCCGTIWIGSKVSQR